MEEVSPGCERACRRSDAGGVPRGTAVRSQGRPGVRAPGRVPALRCARRATGRGHHRAGPAPPRRRCPTHSPRGSRPRWPPRSRPGPWTLPRSPLAAAGAGAATPGTPGRSGSPGPTGQDRTRAQTGAGTGWRGHDRSWLALRVAAVTAAVAVIAGGGYGVAQLLTGSPAVNGAASRSASGRRRPRTSGRRARCRACPPAVSIRRQARPRHRRQRWYLRAPGDEQRHELPVRDPGRPGQRRPRTTDPQCSLNRAARPDPGPRAEPGKPLPRPAACLITHRQRPAPPARGPSQVPRPPSPHRRAPRPPTAADRRVVLAPGCTATTAHVLATATLPRSG